MLIVRTWQVVSVRKPYILRRAGSVCLLVNIVGTMGFIEATRHLFAGSHVAPRDPFCGLYAAPHVVSPGVCVAPDAAPFRSLGQP